MFVQYIYFPSDKYMTVNVLLVKTLFKMKKPKNCSQILQQPEYDVIVPPVFSIESNAFWRALSIYEYNNKVYKFLYKLYRQLTVYE